MTYQLAFPHAHAWRRFVVLAARLLPAATWQVARAADGGYAVRVTTAVAPGAEAQALLDGHALPRAQRAAAERALAEVAPADNLAALFAPEPVDGIADAYLFGTADPAVYAALTELLLDFGCRDLHLAALAAPLAGQTLFIRAQQPKQYVLARCRRDWPATLILQQDRLTPGVWTPPGTAHPLAECIPAAAHDCLILADGTWHTLPPRAWHDAAAKVESRLPCALPEVAALPEPPSVPVTLRLRPQAEGQAAPELWLLRDLTALRTLAGWLGDTALARFDLAAVRAADGAVRYVLREHILHEGGSLLAAATALVAYVPHPALAQVYLPAGVRLFPPLRQDTLARVLGLRGSDLCVLEPDGETITAWRIPQRLFGPLVRLADYELALQEARAEELASGFALRLRRYASLLPAERRLRPVTEAAAGARAVVESAPAALPDIPVYYAPEEAETEAPASAVVAARYEPLPEQLGAILERLVCEGQHAPGWLALADWFRAQRRHGEWQYCFLQYLWQVPVARLIEVVRAAVPLPAAESDWANLTAAGRATDVLPLLSLLRRALEGPLPDAAWWQAGYACLRAREADLPLKAAVLLWSLFLRATHDDVEREHHAQRAHERLAREGQQALAAPPFLLRELLARAQAHQAGTLEELLATVGTRVAKLTVPELRAGGQAVLAYMHAFRGENDVALQLLTTALAGAKGGTLALYVRRYALALEKLAGLQVLGPGEVQQQLAQLGRLAAGGKVAGELLETRWHAEQSFDRVFDELIETRINLQADDQAAVAYRAELEKGGFADTEQRATLRSKLTDRVTNAAGDALRLQYIDDYLAAAERQLGADGRETVIAEAEAALRLRGFTEPFYATQRHLVVAGVLCRQLAFARAHALLDEVLQRLPAAGVDRTDSIAGMAGVVGYLPSEERLTLLTRLLDLLHADLRQYSTHGFEPTVVLNTLDVLLWAALTQAQYAGNLLRRYYREEEQLLRRWLQQESRGCRARGEGED